MLKPKNIRQYWNISLHNSSFTSMMAFQNYYYQTMSLFLPVTPKESSYLFQILDKSVRIGKKVGFSFEYEKKSLYLFIPYPRRMTRI